MLKFHKNETGAAQRMLCPLPGEFMSQDPFCPHQGTIPRTGHSSLIEVCFFFFSTHFFSHTLFSRYLKHKRRHQVRSEEPGSPVVNVTRRLKCWRSTELACLTIGSCHSIFFVDFVVVFFSFFNDITKLYKNSFASVQLILVALYCLSGCFCFFVFYNV